MLRVFQMIVVLMVLAISIAPASQGVDDGYNDATPVMLICEEPEGLSRLLLCGPGEGVSQPLPGLVRLVSAQSCSDCHGAPGDHVLREQRTDAMAVLGAGDRARPA